MQEVNIGPPIIVVDFAIYLNPNGSIAYVKKTSN
jgi:hypothetical protein